MNNIFHQVPAIYNLHIQQLHIQYPCLFMPLDSSKNIFWLSSRT